MELEAEVAKLTTDLDKFGGASRMKAALGSSTRFRPQNFKSCVLLLQPYFSSMRTNILTRNTARTNYLPHAAKYTLKGHRQQVLVCLSTAPVFVPCICCILYVSTTPAARSFVISIALIIDVNFSIRSFITVSPINAKRSSRHYLHY